MGDLAALLSDVVGAPNLVTGDAISADYSHDEALNVEPQRPAYLARPVSAAQVAGLLKIATEHRLPVTARGSGCGLSAAARPVEGGLLISFERMNAVLEVDVDNHVAVVQPGVTLTELDARTAAVGLSYTVYPGELSSSVGGNVGTNAGGMRAVRYGVTRHNVLGLEAVLPTGEIIRTGGKMSKISSGYDLTQLIIGSEGTLAIATEVTVKLVPRLAHAATVLAPFDDFHPAMTAVPKIIATGLAPSIVEYIDRAVMTAIVTAEKMELGVPQDVRQASEAYLVIALENNHADRLHEDAERLCESLGTWGALDAYVLQGASARRLIVARENLFWTVKSMGVDDIIDVVVPRSAMPEFLRRAKELALADGATMSGCGHAGDGNVHGVLFCKDPTARKKVLSAIFALGIQLGGAISGEHGIGRAKADYFAELEDPAKLALLKRIKNSFDPAGILNPGVLFG